MIKTKNTDSGWGIVITDLKMQDLNYKFKSTGVYRTDWDGKEATFIDFMFKKEKDAKSFADQIQYEISEGKSYKDAFKTLNEKLKMENPDYLKFRGDYAEAAYLLEYGGVKIIDGESYDIKNGDDLIEVKSISPSKMSTIISMKQILDKTKKVAFVMQASSEGENIIQMASKLNDDNSSFKDYLIKQYKNSEYEMIQYDSKISFDFTDQLSLPKLPDNIIDAKLTINIKKP